MRAPAIAVGMWGLVLLNCASDDDANTQPSTGNEVPQALVDSCARYCGLTEVWSRGCEPGRMYYHGAELDSDPPEAPVSTDRACIDSCANDPKMLCWQAQVDWLDCSVEAIWNCHEDGFPGTSDCGASGGPELCEGEYTRPEAWRQSDEWTASCTRYCGLAEALVPNCSPGDTRIRGVPLGSDPPDTAPISTDPTCVERCLLPNGKFECAEQLIARNNCFADALWVCRPEVGWYTDECEAEDRGLPQVCE
jgi:hypothetical protein